MALPQWTERSGKTIGTIEERTQVSLPLPIDNPSDVTVTLIAGSLPPGILLQDTVLDGVPFEVNKTTDFEFTLRATADEGIADRTFTIRVEGADAPVWQTPEGVLNLGQAGDNEYWVDTVNSNFNIFASGGTANFTEVDVIINDGVPGDTFGSDDNIVFNTQESQYYFKVNNKWRKMERRTLQAYLGSDIDIQSSVEVPNPNLIDYWLNHNKENGLNISLKKLDPNTGQWQTAKYFIGHTAPATPVGGTIWVHTFDDNLRWQIKIYDSIEQSWNLLDFEYSNIPTNRENKNYFVLDNTPVDFQLSAIDSDLSTGETLDFYIKDGDGELPPGLTLTSDGRITGIVDPILALDRDQQPGYDNSKFDSAPLDFGVEDADGYDSFFYDTQRYGYFTPTRRPKKLNRFYEFNVTVADDVGQSQRRFKIYVVGDDFLRADNTIMKSATGLFTADNTYLRKPIWLTPGNLGVRRANNYITIYLDVFDPNTLLGTVSYILKPFNDDGTPSEIPPGTEIDSVTGEIAGTVPYQPAVSKDYRFTVEALRNESQLDNVEISTNVYEDTFAGKRNLKLFKLPLGTTDGIDDLQALVGQTISLENVDYTIESVNDENADYDIITFDKDIEPTYRAGVLKTSGNSFIGNRYFWAENLSQADQEFYKNLYLNFSDSERYQITEKIIPYRRYIVRTGGADLEFNYEKAGISQVPGETVVEAFRRWLDFAGIDAIDDTQIFGVSDTTIRFRIPATATTRNLNLIKELFHAADSTELDLTISADFLKINLDRPLERNISDGTQYLIGTTRGVSITKRLNVATNEIISTTKTFTIKILGDIENTITWITPSELPTQVANRTSYLKLEATASIEQALLVYDLVLGKLPNGLELKKDGEIVGKVNQFGSASQPGLTTIDNRTTSFDSGTTSIDREFTFTVLVRDRFGFAQSTKEFTIKVNDVDNRVYSNVYIQPYISYDQRSAWTNFIQDYTIFNPEFIYRASDPSFGVQSNLRTLVYAGIETKAINYFVAATAKNTRKKNYLFGELKTAQARLPGSNDIVYEVVYIEIVDPANPKLGDTRLDYKIKTHRNQKINQVEFEVKDDETATEAGIDFFEISTRDGILQIRADGGVLPLYLRDNSFVELQTTGQINILNQDGSITVIRSSSSTISDSGDPFRFRPTTPPITIDSDAIPASQNLDQRRYISNLNNMRKRIKEIGVTERDFLPLWMRTAQFPEIEEINWVAALPICYCKPGKAITIKENIINSGFDFKQINYEIDRYIVDATENNNNEQFILFKNYNFNV